MSRVFVIERASRNMDLSTAEVYGPLHYLFGQNDRRAPLLDSMNYIDDVIAQLRFHKFNKDDWLCITGSMLSVVHTVIALQVHLDEFKLLAFNSSMGQYEEKIINTTEWRRHACTH